MKTSMYISKLGLDFIKSWEGYKLSAYLDSAGVPTIGYGHTNKVKLGLKIDLDTAERYLLEDIWQFEESVRGSVEVLLNQNQFDALVSFAFNVGSANFENSTLLRKLNEGDYAGAAAEFGRWNRAGGDVLKGLVRRRAAEKELFLGQY